MEKNEENRLEKKQYFDPEDLPPQLLSFSETFNCGNDIEIDDISIGEYHQWVGAIVDREKAYGKVWEHLDKQNIKLLEKLQINQHGKEHGNRVAGLTGLLYLSIRGPLKLEKIKEEESSQDRGKAVHRLVRSLISIAEPAGQMHDVGYFMPIKEKGLSELRRVLRSDLQRQELPDHAEHGAQLVKHGYEKICKDPKFYRKFFQEKYKDILLWKGGRYHDSLNQCVRAVRKHTTEQIKHPLTEQQTSGDLPLLVYCADKLDFLNRAPRIVDKEKLFMNGAQVHQRLNLAVIGQNVKVSQKEKHVSLFLQVDPSIPVKLVEESGFKAHYSEALFQSEFFQMYEQGFEEIETIFKVLFTNDINFDENDMNHSTFSVTLRFPNGTTAERRFIGRRGERKKELMSEETATMFLEKIKQDL